MSIIRKLIHWYRVNYTPYVTLCSATEHMFISKALWHKIVDNLPVDRRNDMRVYFERYPVERYVGSGTPPYLYRFFVNPDLSFVKAPDGQPPFTTQIQFGRFGHIGFQSVQPTPIEILTEYKIADRDFVTHSFADYVSLKVGVGKLEETGETYYYILPIEVDSRYRPIETDPDPKTLIQ